MIVVVLVVVLVVSWATTACTVTVGMPGAPPAKTNMSRKKNRQFFLDVLLIMVVGNSHFFVHVHSSILFYRSAVFVSFFGVFMDLHKQEWLHSHPTDQQYLPLSHSPPESLFAPEIQSRLRKIAEKIPEKFVFSRTLLIYEKIIWHRWNGRSGLHKEGRHRCLNRCKARHLKKKHSFPFPGHHISWIYNHSPAQPDIYLYLWWSTDRVDSYTEREFNKSKQDGWCRCAWWGQQRWWFTVYLCRHLI